MFSRVLICGDRDWANTPEFDRIMEKWVATHGIPQTIIEGCARGADRAAEYWARLHGVTVEHYPAQWDQHGRSAGTIRNAAMLDAKPDAVIAIHSDLANSKGTAHMVRIARRAGVPVWVPVPQPQQTLGLNNNALVSDDHDRSME